MSERLIEDSHCGPDTLRIVEQAFVEHGDQIKQRFVVMPRRRGETSRELSSTRLKDELCGVEDVKAAALKTDAAALPALDFRPRVSTPTTARFRRRLAWCRLHPACVVPTPSGGMSRSLLNFELRALLVEHDMHDDSRRQV